MSIPEFFAGQVLYPDDLQALVLPPSVTNRQDTAITGITSTTYAAGSTPCGVAFTAPPSGRVWIFWAGQLDHDTASRETLLAFRVGTGEDLGLGTQVFGASDNVCLSKTATARDRMGVGHLLEGLTAGSVYNAVTMHRVVGGGNGRVARRQITVQASW
ncbi:hypothetical protein ACFFMR_18835 [Micromonospora andamanensis]|uniref:Uncharacterized protein n=1 Tax=Micromonospora andamanensis TaxID=1287068 RepID=A0ABQ4HYK6_9ACTN|nr:hypothetical protein [Micromonospora andamanensis]GIJ10724.1 hypothetical protein Van01_39380 [Micromonospora andamanensis]